jgi:flagellar hook-basal body complex protein FliE
MDLRLNALSALSSAANAQGLRPAGVGQGLPRVGGASPEGAGAVPGANFGDAMRTALNNISAAQARSSELQTQVQLGNPNVSLEETMLAMQKAQIGFQAALHVRNRMMQAYTDVMNMQV